ncbi:MAG: 3'(2'),5'-bisphosphate nucleotidase CysQ [Alkalilacustris sp.]
MPGPDPQDHRQPDDGTVGADAADLALLSEAALAAADIARRHFGQGPAAWAKAGGQGPVSEADLEIDGMLRARLTAARPGYGWLSEESEDDPQRLGTGSVFIVDPIDGTRAFLQGDTGFAHALAVARAGRVHAAVVHLPLLELQYSARRGAGAHLGPRRLTAAARRPDGAVRILASKGQLDPALWGGGLPPLTRHFRSSLAWRLCLVAEGAFDATVSLRDTWDWDTAAATLIAEEAGVRVTDRDGAGLRFNTPHPASHGLIAAAPALHARLLHARTPSPPRPTQG